MSWRPVPEHRADVVTEHAAGSLHDLLDRDGGRPGVGAPLPLLWHWLAFLPRCRQDELGPDGHPRTGTFLPPSGGRARMHAGGSVTLRRPVTVGAPLRRTSVVADVVEKTGRTGPLTFVTVGHTVGGSAGELLGEEQRIVYREANGTAPPAPADDRAWAWTRDVEVDSTLLFRFSALTYNAHRIHYDRAYATGVEGYPGLVVHGPLQAILLVDAAERAHPDRPATRITYRSTAPAFDDAPLRLCLTPTTGDELDLAAYSGTRVTMTARVTLGATPPASSAHRP